MMDRQRLQPLQGQETVHSNIFLHISEKRLFLGHKVWIATMMRTTMATRREGKVQRVQRVVKGTTEALDRRNRPRAPSLNPEDLNLDQKDHLKNVRAMMIVTMIVAKKIEELAIVTTWMERREIVTTMIMERRETAMTMMTARRETVMTMMMARRETAMTTMMARRVTAMTMTSIMMERNADPMTKIAARRVTKTVVMTMKAVRRVAENIATTMGLPLPRSRAMMIMITKTAMMTTGIPRGIRIILPARFVVQTWK
mmetsp:Transcript_3247/g.6116  ORF Transcript_3247/g.6116 Transcript_3247/m.6116 type:complete len:256 (-) Transcript_3247:304-1071(-)